jgi:predicted RNA-binding protein with PIN domain
MNVIGSRPTGWWRDRDGAVQLLLTRLQAYAAKDAVDVTLFVDGRPLGRVPEGVHQGVEVLYAARGGRNAADDRLVEYIRSRGAPTNLHVITSDRELAERARAAGAQVHGAQTLLEQLDALDR